MKELPGIMNHAINGLSRLNERGHFVMPKASEKAVNRFENLTKGFPAFAAEYCEAGPDYEVERDMLFYAYTVHRFDCGLSLPSAVWFGRELWDKYDRTSHLVGRKQKPFVKGLKLTDGGADLALRYHDIIKLIKRETEDITGGTEDGPIEF